MSEPSEPRRRFARRVARSAAWPARRFFDPRFGLVHAELAAAQTRTDAKLDVLAAAMSETLTFVGRELSRMQDRLGNLDGSLEVFVEDHELRAALSGDIDVLGTRVAGLLNLAEGHRGFSAQRELWFNPPLSLHYEPGNVRLASVNERVVEVPFVFGALAGLGVGARVLDVGCAESSVAFSLASLGCVVTALDPRGYPLAHPGVRVVEATLAGWERGAGEALFDAVVFLSSVEHFGLGAYAGSGSAAGADREAVVLARGLVRDGGALVLTVPFGVAAVDGLQRTYGLDELERLVEGWDVREMVFVEQVGLVEWRRLASVPEVVDPGRRYVAMVTATAGTTPPGPR